MLKNSVSEIRIYNTNAKMDVLVKEQSGARKRKKIVEILFEDESKKRYLISPEIVEDKKTCPRFFDANNSKKV